MRTILSSNLDSVWLTGVKTDPPSRPDGRLPPRAGARSQLDAASKPRKPGWRHPHDVSENFAPAHPLLAPSIGVWEEALKLVDRSRPAPEVANCMLHYLPDPMLVVGPTSVERRGRCIRHWLQLRDSWLWMLRDNKLNQLNMQPPRSADWRHFLNAGPESLKPAARPNEKRSGLLRFFDAALTGLELNVVDKEPSWFGNPIALTDDKQMAEIAWELSEVAFRLELRAVDSLMVPPPLNSSELDVTRHEMERDGLVLRVFGNRPLVANSLPTQNEGLASFVSSGRGPCVEALRVLLARWPNAPEWIRNTALTPSIPQPELLVFEKSIATFYVQSFWERAGRAATVPRRLPGVV